VEKDEGPPAVAGAAVASLQTPARYVVLTVTVPQHAAEAVAALLWEAGTDGVELQDGAEGSMTLRAYLPVPAEKDILAGLRRRLAEFPRLGLAPLAPALRTDEIADDAWASGWRRHFRAFRVGRRILIVPSWETPAPEPDDVVIRLDPGMAFGSGLHPSTQLCLMVLEERLRPGDTVADVGTGSGILAIVAARFGAGSVLAVDDDPLALRVAAANVAGNGVADRVTVRMGNLLAPVVSPVDLLVANLTADALAQMAAAVPSRLRPGGLIVASGIIEAGLGGVADAFVRAGLTLEEPRAREEWRALVARRP
jgi:ribosomal protein L11 methyltransferase